MNLETLPVSLQLLQHRHLSHHPALGISLYPLLQQFPPLSQSQMMSGVFQSPDLPFCRLLQELLSHPPFPQLCPISPPLPLLPLSSPLLLLLFTLPPLLLSEWKNLLCPQSSSTSLTGNFLVSERMTWRARRRTI